MSCIVTARQQLRLWIWSALETFVLFRSGSHYACLRLMCECHRGGWRICSGFCTISSVRSFWDCFYLLYDNILAMCYAIHKLVRTHTRCSRVLVIGSWHITVNISSLWCLQRFSCFLQFYFRTFGDCTCRIFQFLILGAILLLTNAHWASQQTDFLLML